jgi:K+-sensing histidine kinase KdpD
MIVQDVTQSAIFLRRVDDETDLVTRDILSVPIKNKERTIGVVSVVNKNHGIFDDTDVDLLSMVANTIALPIENTRIHEELRDSYTELKTLNHAKEKVINHLAHELKTPVSVLNAAMKLLSKKLSALGTKEPLIQKILTRGQRNLDRILEIQYEVEDLLKEKDYRAYHILNRLVDACKDELITLIETETLKTGIPGIEILDRVHTAIENIFGPEKLSAQSLVLDQYLTRRIERLKPEFRHRNCRLTTRIDPVGSIRIPPEILDIIFTGIIRNAFEYTPDGSRIDIVLKKTGSRPELTVTDHGVGFTQKKLYLIFENYFTPPDSSEYSTKKPFDFNAGGRGFDLLRIKVFSGQYGFKFRINSTRCRVLPGDTDVCPGDIGLCRACTSPKDCLGSGKTSVHIQFDRGSLPP